jgi:hypothetical protein
VRLTSCVHEQNNLRPPLQPPRVRACGTEGHFSVAGHREKGFKVTRVLYVADVSGVESGFVEEPRGGTHLVHLVIQGGRDRGILPGGKPRGAQPAYHAAVRLALLFDERLEHAFSVLWERRQTVKEIAPHVEA